MTALRVNTTERTHSADGSKTLSQIDREHREVLDRQELTSTCGVYGCDHGPDGAAWTMTGPAAEVRAAFAEHRRAAHPTADRIARNEARRNGVKPGETSERARQHFEAEAAARRQRMALDALDDGVPQRELTANGSGRDNQTGEPAGEPAPGATDGILVAPVRGPAARRDGGDPQAGSRPGTIGRPKRWTRDRIIEALRQFERDNGRRPAASDLRRPLPAEGIIRREFGTWSAAARAAGFDVADRRTGGGEPWTRETAIEKLQQVAAELGRPPRGDEAGPGLPGKAAVLRLFPSWADYVEAAGFPRPVRGHTTVAPAEPPEPAAVAERHDTDLVTLAIDAPNDRDRLAWIERLEREANRSNVRASALRQIALGLRTLHELEEEAAA